MKPILVITIGYLVGCISPSYFLGKSLESKDIRNHGSGNAGTTNALRVFGKKIGILTFFLDVIKGILAVLIGKYILGIDGAILAGIFAVFGHNWPVFLGFKGGKGVATSFGVLLTLSWKIGIILFLIWGMVIFFTKYVSLASILASILAPLILLVIDKEIDKKTIFAMMFLAGLIILRHKDNIKRLVKGEENKLGSKKS